MTTYSFHLVIMAKTVAAVFLVVSYPIQNDAEGINHLTAFGRGFHLLIHATLYTTNTYCNVVS